MKSYFCPTNDTSAPVKDTLSYLSNADPSAIEELYRKFKNDPDSVDASWQLFFQGFEFSKTDYSSDEDIPENVLGATGPLAKRSKVTLKKNERIGGKDERCVLPAPGGCWMNSEADRRCPVRKMSCGTGISDDHTMIGWILQIIKHGINNYTRIYHQHGVECAGDCWCARITQAHNICGFHYLHDPRM